MIFSLLPLLFIATFRLMTFFTSFISMLVCSVGVSACTLLLIEVSSAPLSSERCTSYRGAGFLPLSLCASAQHHESEKILICSI